ncbi:phage GP46 family protein [Salmonella enterica subsp. enterica serovar Agbeni]|nr:hypothetical protein [Salmonella enterica subsp. enterica serovar Agbeni]EEI6239512.1 hypothetical protein [Salmonella enterica subsp. enterica serovar Tudu]EHW4351821.1 phage GP46 family protein [Salmonella enterica subsp. enterica serovar Agbeni]
MIKLTWFNDLSHADLTITHDGLSVDEGLVTLVLICLFTDIRADDDDELPDGSADRRGWPGDTYSDYPWGSKLWLLWREKLTESVRQRIEDYSRESLKPLIKENYARTTTVTATIVPYDRINLVVVLTRPDAADMTIEISKRWENTLNAV